MNAVLAPFRTTPSPRLSGESPCSVSLLLSIAPLLHRPWQVSFHNCSHYSRTLVYRLHDDPSLGQENDKPDIEYTAG